MSTSPDIQLVAQQFRLEGQFISAALHGSGHIHDTYAIVCDRAGTEVRYILQRINHNVFKHPPRLMENVVRVTNHLRGKLGDPAGQANQLRHVLTVVPTTADASYHQDAAGNYWRVYHYIEGAESHEVLSTPGQAYEVAFAFGGFLRQLTDLPSPPLHATIPDFHNGPVRYQDFNQALAADSCNRAADCQAEIEFLHSHAWVFDVVPQLIDEQRLPQRTTHSDTKLNNVLLDTQSGQGICVIDLDTVMPGVSLYDFGDLVRTCCNQAAEDETDLSQVGLLMPMYEALLRGYLEATGELLTECEREHLAFSGMLMTLLVGTRFLTDYLGGDTYYRIHREQHNLARCRSQFKLVEHIRDSKAQLDALADRM